VNIGITSRAEGTDDKIRCSPVLDHLQYRVLCLLAPASPSQCSGAAYRTQSKLDVLLGKNWRQEVKDKVVIDFGCGDGGESVEIARAGARRVIGVDIRDALLWRARETAELAGVDKRCHFTCDAHEQADMIISLDSFEHFSQPEPVLAAMHDLLPANGVVLAGFGPTWYHPYGGHLFSVFPWAHLLFSEKALIRWRSTVRNDGATRFSEVEGGLNQMTIARFERLLAAHSFNVAYLEPVPIRRLGRFHNRLTREFLSAIVRVKLIKREATERAGAA